MPDLRIVILVAATVLGCIPCDGAAESRRGALERSAEEAAEPAPPRIARRVGYHVTPEARQASSRAARMDAETGTLLLAAVDDLFRESFDLAVSLPALPADPKLAAALDEIVVVRAPTGGLDRKGLAKLVASHEFTFDVLRADGTPIGTYRASRIDEISLWSLGPAENIAKFNHGMRQHVRGGVRSFLEQLAGGGSPAGPAALQPGAESVAALFDGQPRAGTAGLYAHESAITFNVLDGVVLDDEGRVTLVGHRDPAIDGPRIPYLQHLAALLRSPEPEFSLDWTPESERAVDAMLDRFESGRGEFSAEGRRRMMQQWTNLFDASGRLTPDGRVMLPAFGVHPGGRAGVAPGRFGAAFQLRADSRVGVLRVEPGSPAERGGLREGDIVDFVDGRLALDVPDVVRQVRLAGAGATMTFLVERDDEPMRGVTAVLDAAPGDPWASFGQADGAQGMLRASGRAVVADYHANALAFGRLAGTPAQQRAFERVLHDLGVGGDWESWRAAVGEGRLSQSDGILEFGRVLARRLDSVFETEGAPLAALYERLVSQGTDTAYAMNPVIEATQEHLDRLLLRSVEDIMGRGEGFAIPPGMLAAQLGVGPEVVPRFVGVEPTSQLARVMFQADFLGKRLIDFPDLARAVPGYVTESAFHRARGESGRSGTWHMWISVGSVDVAQSPDRDALGTRGARLRFNVRQRGDDGRDLAGGPDAYGDLLTSLQDPLARELPVLHELRECAKLAAAARWLAHRRPELQLPEEGLVAWDGPQRVPGLLTMRLHRAPDGFDTILAAVGGASLLLPFPRNEASLDAVIETDASVVDLRGIADDARPRVPAVPPPSTTASAGASPRPAIDRIFVPPWRPEGWVAVSRRGEKLVQLLMIDPSTGGSRTAEFQRSTAQCRELAVRLAGVERAIATLTSTSPDRHAALEGIEADLREANAKFVEHSASLVSQGLLDAHSALRERGMLAKLGFAGELSADAADGMAALEDLSERLEQLDGWISRVRSASAGDRERVMAELRSALASLLPDALEGTRLGAALAPIRKVVDVTQEAEDVLGILDSLSSLGLATLELGVLEPRTEAESAALRDKLLPLQRRLTTEVQSCLAKVPEGAPIDSREH